MVVDETIDDDPSDPPYRVVVDDDNDTLIRVPNGQDKLDVEAVGGNDHDKPSYAQVIKKFAAIQGAAKVLERFSNKCGNERKDCFCEILQM